jgi:magnesium chelatase family protein
MLAKVTSCALVGLEGVIVDVEVDTSRGMPSLIIVGLPDAAVKESSERVRSAIKDSALVCLACTTDTLAFPALCSSRR